MPRIHFEVINAEFAGGSEGPALLKCWKDTCYDTKNLLHQAVLNTRVDCFFIICYVSVMFMLSYHQMQKQTSFGMNTLLRVSLLLCFITGLLDYIENIILFFDFHHALTDGYFISSKTVTLPKFILAGWITLVWLAGFVTRGKGFVVAK